MKEKDGAIDYWNGNIKWSIGKNNNIKCTYIKFEIVDKKRDYFEDFSNLGVISSFSFLTLMPLMDYFTAQVPKHIDDATLNILGHLFKDYWAAFEGIFLMFMLITCGVIVHIQFKRAVATDRERKGIFKDNVAKEHSKVFSLDGVNKEQTEEIIDELNRLKKNNNQVEYMKIVENLIKGDEKIKEMQRVENKKRSLEAKKTKLEKVKKNPYLNSKLYATELENLASDFIKLNEGEFNKDFENRLQKVSKKIDELYTLNGESKIIKDCRSELIEVTRKYNDMVENGVMLSQVEVKSYEELVKTCEAIVNLNVTKELTGELTNSALVSNIYLKDKYNI